MKKLHSVGTPPPFIDGFIAIRNSMQNVPNGPRARLAARHQAIRNRYEALEESTRDMTLELLTPNPYLNSVSDDLESAYTGASARLRALKRQIRAAQDEGVLNVCPLCKISLPRTFDHYLPLGTFPEFAVHPLNLVPSCNTCNGKKHEAWLDENGDRICLHFYSDDIPQTPFIQCAFTSVQLGGRNVGVIFSLQKPLGLRNARWDPIIRHFNRLGLIERYNELGNDELSAVLGSARDFLDFGGPRTRVRGFIRAGATRFANVHGIGYWRAKLWMDVAASVRLFTWLDR